MTGEWRLGMIMDTITFWFLLILNLISISQVGQCPKLLMEVEISCAFMGNKVS
jgi:hypothetical protein